MSENAHLASQNGRLVSLLQGLITQVLGVTPAELDPYKTFIELGAESLTLLQFSQALQDQLGVKIPFRALMEQHDSLAGLVAYLEQTLPQEPAPTTAHPATAEAPPPTPQPAPTALLAPVPQPAPPPPPAMPAPLPAMPAMPATAPSSAGATSLERIMAQQLQLMAQQLELLRGGRAAQPLAPAPTHAPAYTLPPAPTPPPAHTPAPAYIASPAAASPAVPGISGTPAPTPIVPTPPATSEATLRVPTEEVPTRPLAEFVPYQPIRQHFPGGLSAHQHEHLQALTARILKRTGTSKQITQDHRRYLADNRVVTGFRLPWKELCYPLVVPRAQGAHVWDADGNEYVDLTMGFGALLFGHSPDFVVEALRREVELGNRLGPQSHMAGKVAKLFCEMTGNERAAFCNSGTEAVMAAMRIARQATKRTRIALFPGSYHGHFDGTLVRGEETPDGRLIVHPLAPGVIPNFVEDIVLLHYDRPESIEFLRTQGHTLAAVLIEPPRSRRPDMHSAEFLHALRMVTAETGTLLIFDEVVTGFRTHTGGVQALFDIRADLATYGKTIGGGMPIGILAGKAQYMDAIDGGFWQYGDDSYPTAEMTFFAGTFCKHSLTMAAAWAVLNHLKTEGPSLQERLTQRTADLVATLNAYFQAEQVPISMVHFGSLFRFMYGPELKFMDFFFLYLLERGVYVWEGRNCFLSTAHTDADIAQVVQAVKEGIEEMRAAQFLPPGPERTHTRQAPATVSPAAARPAVSGVSGIASATASGTPPVTTAQHLPLTEGQKQLWFVCQMDEHASAAYHLSMTLTLRGPLNVDALHRALAILVARHAALRTTFSATGEEQIVAPTLVLDCPLVDVSHLAPDRRTALADERLAQEARAPFDLVQGPLLRACLLKHSPDEHQLALTLHHIISDGQSLGIMITELDALYTAEATGQPATLPPPTAYPDYVSWQAAQHASPAGVQDERYWLTNFQGTLPVLDLPTDRARPPVQTFVGARYTTTFSGPLRQQLKQVGAQHGCTLFVTLLAGFKTLIHRFSGQSDVVIGVPSAGQYAMGAESLLGYCINLLPVRTAPQGTLPFTDYLATVKQALLNAYEHQNYPFSRLIKKLNPPRDPSRPPLVTVAFNVDHSHGALQFGGLQVAQTPNATHAAQFDLDLNIVDTGQALVLECDYNTDLFDEATLARWFGHYQALLTSIAASALTPLGDLQLLTPEQYTQVVQTWNASQADYPHTACFHDLFEAQAARTPDARAAVCAGQALTYRELNARANQLAHQLVAAGVGRNVVVALLADRSLDFLTAMLAVFKAGGAYVPLDPLYPPQRHYQTLAQSGTPLVLTAPEYQPVLDQALADVPAAQRPRVLLLPELFAQKASNKNLPRRSSPDDLAYVIFTSGSTGLPKGAMVEQRGMINHLYSKVYALELTPADQVAETASQCFDISVWQFLVALLLGGTVHIYGDEIAHNPAVLLDQVVQDNVTILEIVPSLMRLIIAEVERRAANRPGLTALRWLIPTGEALPPELGRQWLAQYPHVPLMNAYGPTECSDDVTHYPIFTPPAATVVNMPVGRPIINMQLYVLDRRGLPTPISVNGELFVGGVGVGRGYLNDPARTADAFRPDPFSATPGARLYKTGDLVRYLTDGNVEFLGRIDHQVKVRGFRIELGEIEATLSQHDELREVVVVAREDAPGEKRLVAYVVPHRMPGPAVSDLRAYLKSRLPEYMVPAAFVALERLPLTPNGKIDRKALPAPDRERVADAARYAPPLTPIEKLLAQIWAQVLNLPRVGVEDNFFELGGDSILSIQIIARAHEAGLHLTPKQLFQYQTIAELAAVAATAQPASANQADQGLTTGPAPLTPIQHWFFEQALPEPHYFNQFVLLSTPPDLDLAALTRTLHTLALHHDALRLRFTRESGGWRQAHGDLEALWPVTTVDLATVPASERPAALERAAQQAQASFNLTAGPLARAVYFRFGGQQPGRLFLVAHHLVVDIFSWRVLLENFHSVYTQLTRGETPALPAKTTSYKQWAEHLAAYAASPKLHQEATFWLEQVAGRSGHLPIDFIGGRRSNSMASAQTLELALAAPDTQALLQEAPKAYRTQINDILLTALVQAFANWTGERTLLIDLEGHGREPLFDDVNLTRTVGWFTSIYPVLLDPGDTTAPGDALKAVKEQLRRIPNGGIGYGVLRHLNPDAEFSAQLRAQPRAEVCFNYLGQLDASGTSTPTAWAPADDATGAEQSLQGQRRYLLEVNGFVRDGQLTMAWRYSGQVHEPATIKRLAQDFMDALRTLVAHCLSPEAGGVTPSDFGMAKLDQQKLGSILSKVKFGGAKQK